MAVVDKEENLVNIWPPRINVLGSSQMVSLFKMVQDLFGGLQNPPYSLNLFQTVIVCLGIWQKNWEIQNL